MSIIEKYSDFEDSLIGKDLKSYQEINKFQEYFDGIARYIFGNVAITTGKDKQKIKYYLDEIEFYYNNGIIPEEEITFITKKGEEKKDKTNFSLAHINVKEMRNSYSGIIVV